MIRWLFRLKCFLHGLPTFWIRRKYNRVWDKHFTWDLHRCLGSPVTLKELLAPGYIYAPYVPLTQSQVDWDSERFTNYRSWAKKEIARMEEEMAVG